MPYIKKDQRDFLSYDVLRNVIPENAGDLNFCFTLLIKNYMENKGEKYQNYNDVIGALEGAKLELYRRKIGRYEDEKILENGDVY